MTGAGIVAIGGMMIRPRRMLPPSDLAVPAFLFRASANGLKLIILHTITSVSNITFSAHAAPSHQRRSHQHLRQPPRVRN